MRTRPQEMCANWRAQHDQPGKEASRKAAPRICIETEPGGCLSPLVTAVNDAVDQPVSCARKRWRSNGWPTCSLHSPLQSATPQNPPLLPWLPETEAQTEVCGGRCADGAPSIVYLRCRWRKCSLREDQHCRSMSEVAQSQAAGMGWASGRRTRKTCDCRSLEG